MLLLLGREAVSRAGTAEAAGAAAGLNTAEAAEVAEAAEAAEKTEIAREEEAGKAILRSCKFTRSSSARICESTPSLSAVADVRPDAENEARDRLGKSFSEREDQGS